MAADVMRTVGTIMRLLVALLGVPFPPRHAIAASSAREGEKVSNVRLWKIICGQSLENVVVEALLVPRQNRTKSFSFGAKAESRF